MMIDVRRYLVGMVLLAGLVIVPGARAGAKETASTVAPLYRVYVFETVSKMNPETTFVLKEISVEGLWEKLGVQIFAVTMGANGQLQVRDPVIFREGKIIPFVTTFGGYGLMSGVVVGDVFYYSYSWGSGIHRSLVGRLSIAGGKLVQQESEPWWHEDVYVEKTGSGEVTVHRGDGRSFQAFNRWTDTTVAGLIDLAVLDRLRIVGKDGREVAAPGVARTPARE